VCRSSLDVLVVGRFGFCRFDVSTIWRLNDGRACLELLELLELALALLLGLVILIILRPAREHTRLVRGKPFQLERTPRGAVAGRVPGAREGLCKRKAL
jgi:hypothetical protein